MKSLVIMYAQVLMFVIDYEYHSEDGIHRIYVKTN
jgi:hypothetical protein